MRSMPNPNNGIYLAWVILADHAQLPVLGQGRFPVVTNLAAFLYHPTCSMPPKHFFLLCGNHQLHQPRKRLTADPPRRCAGKSTRTITKLESEAERGRGQTLIMARPWLDMLWKVTVDESSIIYSSAELSYLFFQQYEQQGIMAQNKQPVVVYSCDCQQTAGQAQWWL